MTEFSLSNLVKIFLYILYSSVVSPRRVCFLREQKWLRSNGLVFPSSSQFFQRSSSLAAVSVSAAGLQIALPFSNSALRTTTVSHGNRLPQCTYGTENSNWKPSPQKPPKAFKKAECPWQVFSLHSCHWSCCTTKAVDFRLHVDINTHFYTPPWMAEVNILVLFPAPAPSPYRLSANKDLRLPISHVRLQRPFCSGKVFQNRL